MSGTPQDLTHGTFGVGFAYGTVFAALLAGLIRAHATRRNLLLSPAMAIPVTLLAALVLAAISPLLEALGIEHNSVLHLVFGIAASAAIGYLSGRLLASRGSSQDPLHRRGAVVSTAQPAAALRADHSPGNATDKTSSAGSDITLAGVPVLPEDETKHFKLIGATGTGKSTAIHEILTAALARGDRAIIADPDGGYLRRFYDPDRDLILNPFDGEAHKWDLFGEITNDYDVDQLARSLIPDRGGEDRIWSDYARTLLTAAGDHCKFS